MKTNFVRFMIFVLCALFVSIGFKTDVLADAGTAVSATGNIGVAGGVRGYYRFPAIHQNTVIFSAEGDLWKVPLKGGVAMRLTTHIGNEAFTKISPDGKLIAFSAEYDGNVDVYVMSIDGGEPERLTFHPGADEVVAWKPDGRSIVFRSRRISPNWERYLFEVPVVGGHPSLINVGPGALASFSEDDRYIAFNRRGGETRTWKRYTGGTAQDIWVGDLKNNEFKQLTDWAGSDRFPMWYNNRIYYLSDQDGNRLNIYSVKPDGTDLKQHTYHVEYDAQWPDMHNGRIVYMYAGDLWSLDVNTGTNELIDITIASDRIRLRPHLEDASETVEDYALNYAGDRIVVSSRGEMWVSPAKTGRVIQLTESSNTRERAAAFSKVDNDDETEKIACITDETGEQEIAIYDSYGSDDKPEILTDAGKGWIFAPVWSPDGSKIAYADMTLTLYVVDVATGESKVVEQNKDGWEITEYEFSPDSKWLAFTRPEQAWGSQSDICIYDIKNETVHTVTTPFSNDFSPSWDPDGRYLYFLSSRSFNPILCDRDFQHIVTNTTKICVLILAKDGLSPFLSDEMYKDTGWFDGGTGDEETESDKDIDKDNIEEAVEEEDKINDTDDIIVDIDGLINRVIEFPAPARNYKSLQAGNNQVFYVSFPTEGLLDEVWGEADKRASNTLYMFNLEEAEEEVVLDGIRDYTISGNYERIAFRIGDEIQVCDVSGLPGAAEDTEEGVNPSVLRLMVDPAGEWEQIFREAWRLQRDFYFAENMANIDWDLVYERYCRLLPRISSRQELNELIGQVIGELGTSHTYIWGGDTIDSDGVSVGLLGADLELDKNTGLHRFTKILEGEVWETDMVSPLTMTHAKVKEGDYLFKINNHELEPGENIYSSLAGLAGEEVLLTVGSQADRSDARDIQIETLYSDQALRYRDWCKYNREYVDKMSNGRVGYFHLPDMDGAGLVRFIQGFYSQRAKDALIIDIRYNGGGFVSQMIIERLARKVWAYDFPRRGKPATYPDKTHTGPKAVIINQFAGSDGDIFPESFRLRELGTIVGKRTWGGVVGIRADKAFVDGGISTQPEFAWWEPKRGWGLENNGVTPDIEVEYLPEDYIKQHDPQLERALDVVLQELKQDPVIKENPPVPPDKSFK